MCKLFLLNCRVSSDPEVKHYSGNFELWGGGPTYGVESVYSKKKYLNINLIDLMSIITNPVNRLPMDEFNNINELK